MRAAWIAALLALALAGVARADPPPVAEPPPVADPPPPLAASPPRASVAPVAEPGLGQFRPCRAGARGPSSDYVGHRTCTQFGQWAMPMRLPSMFFDLGFAARSVSLPVTDLARPAIAGASTIGGMRLTAPAITMTFRAGVGLRHGVYVGLETEIGGVGGAAESAPISGSPAPGAAMFVGGYVVTGIRGALGRLSLSTELAVGGRVIQGETVNAEGMTGFDPAIGQGVVEARVRAELWLSPWVSAGVALGTSLVDRDDTMAGVYLGVHTRAFAGDRTAR